MVASADAEQSRLLGLVSTQAAALADKERQLEVSVQAGNCRGRWGPCALRTVCWGVCLECAQHGSVQDAFDG